MTSSISFDLTFLFFFLGVVAAWAKSDLEIAPSVSKFLSIFLLLSLGLKGGREVAAATNLADFYLVSFIGLGSCVVISLCLFPLLRRFVGSANAAALAAAYGSVSAVTFIAGQEFLAIRGVASSGYMVALMALMEVPAILISIFLYRNKMSLVSESEGGASLFAAKSVILLLGGFVIGFVMNDRSWNGIAPVVQGGFKGVLAFFLLDLGILAQGQLRSAWKFRGMALLTACLLPLVSGSIVLLLAKVLGVPQGDQVLLGVLAGSASYIAAPAAIRSSILEANPSLYVALPLALTFPMNVVLGVPYYFWLSTLF